MRMKSELATNRKLTIKSPATLSKVFGGFIFLLCTWKLFSELSSAGTLPTGVFISLVIGFLIALLGITFSHKLIFTATHVTSQTSYLWIKKQKQYDGLESINLDVALTDGNGPSRVYINLCIKPTFKTGVKQRKYSITTLFGIHKNELFKGRAKKKNEIEIEEFNAYVHSLISLYPAALLVAHERVPDLYKSITNKDIPWEYAVY